MGRGPRHRTGRDPDAGFGQGRRLKRAARDLFQDWEGVAGALSRARKRLLLFDVDGTLSRIVPTPEEARVGRKVRQALEALNRRPGFNVGVVSGRSLSDTRRLVPGRNLIRSGNHGLEIEAPGLRFVHPAARRQAGLLRVLAGSLRKALGGIRGPRVENKGLTASVHFRKVAPGRLGRFRDAVRGPLRSPAARGFRIRQGKKVIEIVPDCRWTKGDAVACIVRRLKPDITLYAGDDATDEHVFKTLRAGDISVRVGPGRKTAARHFMKSQKDISRLLKKLEAL